MARAMRILPLPRRLRALRENESGTTILEFGLIAPTLCVMLMGALDYAHTLYMQSVLQGAVQKAGRDGSLQTAAGTDDAQRYALDTWVRNQLLTLHKNGTITIRRRFYRSFTAAQAQAPETFVDTADPTSPFHDGICNNNETFDDRNSNGVRDIDGADSVDHAGARDNVVYTVTISYPRMLPIDKLIGGSGTTTLTAKTVLSNQPYGTQAAYGAPAVGHCTTP